MAEADKEEKEKNESFTRKYKWQIIAFFITGIIALVGAMKRAQTEIEIGLVMFIGGSLLSIAIFLGTLTTKSKEDVNEIVEKYVRDVRKEFDAAIKTLSSNLAAIWTPTMEKNVEIAEDMTKRLGRQGSLGAGYDTSSHRNPDSYEKLVLENVKKGVFYQRLVCFDPDDEENPTRQWYLELMSTEYDKEHRFAEWRKLMQDGKIQILHLPRTLDLDILVTNVKGTNKCEALFGFITEEAPPVGVYNSGLYVPTPRTTDKNLAVDTYGLFKKLWRKALYHAAEQKEIDPEDRCICNIYVEVRGNTVKNVPVVNKEEASV